MWLYKLEFYVEIVCKLLVYAFKQFLYVMYGYLRAATKKTVANTR